MTNPYREANCSFCLMLLFFHQRYYVLYMAPNLKFLDSTPVTSVERKEAKRIGAFTKVVSADFEDEVSKNCVFILIESPGCVNETLSQKMVRKFFCIEPRCVKLMLNMSGVFIVLIGHHECSSGINTKKIYIYIYMKWQNWRASRLVLCLLFQNIPRNAHRHHVKTRFTVGKYYVSHLV